MPQFIIRDKVTGKRYVAPQERPFDPDRFEVVESEESPFRPGKTVGEPSGQHTQAGARDHTLDLLLNTLLGAGAGAAVGRGGSKLLGALGRIRPFGFGRGGDVGRMAKAVRKEGTALQPKGTSASLAESLIGRGGRRALSQAYAKGEGELKAQLGQESTIGGLLDELKELNRKTAKAKESGPLKPLRQRAEVMSDIEALLNPAQQKQFQTMQRQYGVGSEMRRTAKASKAFGGTSGFDQARLQEAGIKRAETLPEGFKSALYRRAFPKTDVEIDPLLRARGGEVTVGSMPTLMRVLAGPGPFMRPFGTRTGLNVATGAGALGGAALADKNQQWQLLQLLQRLLGGEGDSGNVLQP